MWGDRGVVVEMGGAGLKYLTGTFCLLFLDGSYLPTFSPVNMMMNNISWRAAECVSPGEGPGSLRLLPVSSYFLCDALFSQNGDKGVGGDNRCHPTRTPPQKHPSQGSCSSPSTPLTSPPPPSPQNIFISIIKQFFYMLIHQSGLRLICGRGLPLSFQVSLTPWQTFVPLYVAHKAPALSALIDQRPAVEEERSTPYQWCYTSAAEKNLHLFQRHAQFLGDNEHSAVNSSCSSVFLSCVYRQGAYLLDGGNRQFKK